jgi:endo-1,4-beta-xylanase
MKRRDFLALGAAAGGYACLSGALPSVAQPAGGALALPLKSYGAPCGMYVGVQSEKANLQQPAVAEFITANFNLLTAGNELKWSRLRPDSSTFNFADADWIANFARQHNMLLHGHNLCWNADNPQWLATVLNRSNARSYLTDHITKVMGRYAGQIDSWDVVNEPFAVWQGRPDGLYKGIWLDLLGPEYIDLAFDTAAKADPKALRVLNLHHIEQDTAVDEKTRQLTLSFLKQLISRGVPIQAIGVESHLSAADPIGGQSLDRFLKAIRDLGLEIIFTEIDINDTSVAGSEQERDQMVAKYYYNYLTRVIPVSSPKRMIFWTATDKQNWMDYLHTSQYSRADGMKHRPGLLDEKMQPKTAFSAVVSALQQTCR